MSWIIDRVFAPSIELEDRLAPLKANTDKSVAASYFTPDTSKLRRSIETAIAEAFQSKADIPPEVFCEVEAIARVFNRLHTDCTTLGDVMLTLADSDLRGPAWRGWKALAKDGKESPFPWAGDGLADASPAEVKTANDKAHGAEAKAVRTKRSTESGEARAKIVAALTAHHKYGNGSCGNFGPIGVNELARLAEVSSGSVSQFFQKHFAEPDAKAGEGLTRYKAACRERAKLCDALELLNGDKPPWALWKRYSGDDRED